MGSLTINMRGKQRWGSFQYTEQLRWWSSSVRSSPTAAGSPELIELICAQGGNERTSQLCHGSCLPQFQPVVDTAQVAHPLRTELPPCRIEEDEAQHGRVVGVALLLGLQPLGEVRAR